MSSETPKPDNQPPETGSGAKSLADEVVNRFIAGVIALMILFFGVPMAIGGFDSIAAGLAGEHFTLWNVGVLAIGVVMIILGVGMLWLAVKPPYGKPGQAS